MRPTDLLVAIAIATLLSCSGSSSSDDSATKGHPGDGRGGSTGVDQDPACAQYIDCVSAVEPTMVSEASTAYGSSSACWDSAANASDCADQCASALSSLHASYPAEDACDDGSPIASETILALLQEVRMDIHSDDGQAGCDAQNYRRVDATFAVTANEDFTGGFELSSEEGGSWYVEQDWTDVPCSNDGFSVHCDLPAGTGSRFDATFDATVSDDLATISGTLAVDGLCTFEVSN